RCFHELMNNPCFVNKLAYERSAMIANIELSKSLVAQEDHVINNPNPKTFWSYINRRLSRHTGIRSMLDSGKEFNDNQSISNIFNKYFSSIFICESKTNFPRSTSNVTKDNIAVVSSFDLSIDEVANILKRLPPKTSTDADGLSYYVLKRGGVILATYLFHIFNLSLELCRVPSLWKIAMVTPLYKSGCKSFVHNYRPISVTSCCSRVLERIINFKIKYFLAENCLIASTQHGFSNGRSTDTALLQFYDNITQSLDNNLTVEVVFFDFSKAFDTVPHTVLISRLSDIGIRGSALEWIEDFLSARYQKVRVGESFSRLLPVTSGVIQGSVLGPTLFNIFVDSLDSCLKYCSIIKYADDLRIFLTSSKNVADVTALRDKIQFDINSLADWANQSGMSFNIQKCFTVSFGLPFGNQTDLNYNIRGESIPNKTYFKDLGVIVCSPLSFNVYMDDIVSRAFRRLGLVYKLFHLKSPKSIVRLYKSFVRPILEYASIIWNP
ncbi:MAG: reverse transcriptase family protein, partial [Cyanobacteria bacterium J06600_6]